MASLPLTRRKFTHQEYLTIERSAAYRSEFLDGEINAMAGASEEHITITDNLTGEIHAQLKGTPCQGMSQDMKVRIGEEGLFAYPDYLIVCGEKQYLDANRDVLLNPVVIMEVLSPSTEQYDRTTKFDRYKQLETLQDYVLIAQGAPRVEHYSRGQDGLWGQQIFIGLEATLVFPDIAVTLALRDIYDRIAFGSP